MSKCVRKKTTQPYYNDIVDGLKQFEIRKDEDGIQLGDTLILAEWDGKSFTGNYIDTTVKYVLRNCESFGLRDGFCVIGFDINLIHAEVSERGGVYCG